MDKFRVSGFTLHGESHTETHLLLFNGTFSRGLVKLGNYDVILVVLLFCSGENSRKIDKQSFQAVYYKSSPIYLQKRFGQMTFPLNEDKLKFPFNYDKLEFQAGKHFADQLIMLNFTRLQTNASNKVTVDGVPVNTTSHTMFLQSIHAPGITITLDMPQKEVITFHYWIVSGKCSEQLLNKSKKQWIIYLCQKH